MTTCREEALRWVHIYAAGGAAFAAIPMPLSTSAGLAALETHMIGFIAAIYADPVGAATTAAASGSFAVAGQGLKYIATQAACLVPVIGSLIRMGIAGATIESLGRAIVSHYERKFPGKMLTPKQGSAA